VSEKHVFQLIQVTFQLQVSYRATWTPGLAHVSSGAAEHYRLFPPQKLCLWSPQSQRKMIQICASTGSPGAKDHLSVAVRRHFLVRRTDSTGD
ncbi:cDNA sequence BC054059, isoform CRA_a, partial [Mus musculus]